MHVLSFLQVLDKLIERDREIQQLTETGKHKSLRFEQ